MAGPNSLCASERASAELLCDQLHPVANAEQRNALVNTSGAQSGASGPSVLSGPPLRMIAAGYV